MQRRCLFSQRETPAYAGFAMTLGSALVAHFAVGEGPEKWSFASGTGVLLPRTMLHHIPVAPKLGNSTSIQ